MPVTRKRKIVESFKRLFPSATLRKAANEFVDAADALLKEAQDTQDAFVSDLKAALEKADKKGISRCDWYKRLLKESMIQQINTTRVTKAFEFDKSRLALKVDAPNARIRFCQPDNKDNNRQLGRVNAIITRHVKKHAAKTADTRRKFEHHKWKIAAEIQQVKNNASAREPSFFGISRAVLKSAGAENIKKIEKAVGETDQALTKLGEIDAHKICIDIFQDWVTDAQKEFEDKIFTPLKNDLENTVEPDFVSKNLAWGIDANDRRLTPKHRREIDEERARGKADLLIFPNGKSRYVRSSTKQIFPELCSQSEASPNGVAR